MADYRLLSSSRIRSYFLLALCSSGFSNKEEMLAMVRGANSSKAHLSQKNTPSFPPDKDLSEDSFPRYVCELLDVIKNVFHLYSFHLVFWIFHLAVYVLF
ncbi:hypothetical protein MANES_04G084666v8 [Manihot esculenta]|uniref:Uncharacterized protein n=1 Tax=Manihot esculenta TaxID=3983 RepID=A0ACB7HUB9_MANES|nr:hypothetical protein MANES_04G084666v8 [Manihot esculenta]